jgi:Xaa-Pro aminopeptidase
MAKHREVLSPKRIVDHGIFGYGMLLELFWCLIGTFENRYCRFADQAEVLVSFERHEEIISRRFDEPIAFENAILSRAMAQTRLFKEDRELQLFPYGLSQTGKGYHRGMLALQPAMENPEPTPGVLARYHENMQDEAAVAEILCGGRWRRGRNARRRFP